MTTGLPQGSTASPILFVIYISEVHDAVADRCSVVPISFLDNVMDIDGQVGSRGTVQYRLERAAESAIGQAKDNGRAFEIAKTEAILFSRSRKHWKERAGAGVRVKQH